MIFVREGIEDLRFSFRDCVQRPDLVVEIDTRTSQTGRFFARLRPNPACF
jgi:hypothetical protein